MFRKARIRFTALTAGLILLMFALFVGGVIFSTVRLIVVQQQQSLDRQAQELAHDAEGALLFGIPFTPQDELTSASYIVWNSSGSTVTSHGKDLSLLATHLHQGLKGTSSEGNITLSGHPYLYEVVPLLHGSSVIGTLGVATSQADISDAEREGLTTVVIAGMALVAASIIVAWYLAGRAMTPLEDSYKRQQQFTSEASHELRTPLTIIDSGLQVLGRHPDQTIAANTDVLDSMRLEIRRLQRLVEDLLTLARSDNGALSLNRELVEADPLISEIYGDFAASTPSPPFTFSPCISTVGTVYLDPDRLRQLLIILIDNAVSHNPDGVHIRLTASRSGQTLEIVVEDDGIGIPPEQLGRVFERFHRVGVARHARGTGLGLPIAKWIVEAHGGSIQLRPKAQGLAVHVSIPLSQAPPGVN